MDVAVAHELDAKQRTDDVRLKEVSPFSKMLLSDAVRKGLQQAGFVYPTVIQAAAIPLGKAGMDLLVQSKSGTGKTLIFSTILLESYRSDVREPQALIVVPTREIAVQIESVLNQLGRFCTGFRAVSVIGGLEIADDRKRLQAAKAVVGTPGRLLHLLQNEVLNTARIRLLVLDEADKMYTQSFRQDLQRIRNALPAKRQTIACSATFCNELDKEVAKIMQQPLLISTEERATLLIGIKQFVYELPEQKTSILEMGSKLDALRALFGRISFKQCLMFAGSQSRADSYRNYLEKEGWPCELISGAQDQRTRLEMFHKFREFKTRLLIATDLMSRGIDAEHVNLVINLEVPTDVTTFLHRIGRAGRFGSHGIAITFIASAKDRALFSKLTAQVGSGMQALKFPQQEATGNLWDFSDFAAERQLYGCFGSDPLAPLASYDKDSLSSSSHKPAVDNDKENCALNANAADVVTSSSIDTATFHVESVGQNLLELLVEQPAQNGDVAALEPVSAPLQLTPHSQQSELPSSNTIDDASSIAADSVRSSQQDISRYQSILMQKVAIPTLVEFLVDPKSAADAAQANAKPPQIDLFEDYELAQQQEEQISATNSQSLAPKIHAINFKSLLIDEPPAAAALAAKQPKNNAHTDIYSDYANFVGDEASSSVSLPTTCASESIDQAATFIMSVATPSHVPVSMEELAANTSSLELSHGGDDEGNTASMSDQIVSLSEVQHFPSPAHNQPNVMPQCGLPMPEQLPNLVEAAGAAAAQERLPSTSSSLSGSNETMSSGQHASAEASGSSTERGASSGFDERATSSSSSGIATSDVEVNEAVDDFDDYITSSENAEEEEDATEEGATDEENNCNYTETDDEIVNEHKGKKEKKDTAKATHEVEEEEESSEEDYFGNEEENYNNDDDDEDDDEEEDYFAEPMPSTFKQVRGAAKTSKAEKASTSKPHKNNMNDDDDEEEENYFNDDDDDDDEEEDYFAEPMPSTFKHAEGAAKTSKAGKATTSKPHKNDVYVDDDEEEENYNNDNDDDDDEEEDYFAEPMPSTSKHAEGAAKPSKAEKATTSKPHKKRNKKQSANAKTAHEEARALWEETYRRQVAYLQSCVSFHMGIRNAQQKK